MITLWLKEAICSFVRILFLLLLISCCHFGKRDDQVRTEINKDFQLFKKFIVLLPSNTFQRKSGLYIA